MDSCAFPGLFDKYDTIIFFDTETTGLDAAQEQIIELAAVAMTRDGVKGEMDKLICLHTHASLPEKIVELTHITDEMLLSEGVEECAALDEFMALFGERTLLCAYNAQFDLDFIANSLIRSAKEHLHLFNSADYLDSLCVAKDRKRYPHKLCDLIEHYGVEAVNSHRALDDVVALIKVTEAMQAERNDLYKYINLFGYNPKYGLPARRLKKVHYHPQPLGEPKTKYETLPYVAGFGEVCD